MVSMREMAQRIGLKPDEIAVVEEEQGFDMPVIEMIYSVLLRGKRNSQTDQAAAAKLVEENIDAIIVTNDE
ncbi:MAG: hypothetical protein GW762_02010 [Candidatus Pacebacteria bacterium]|nr:hypothetical protein [Candidatus Paceibacterota bacterium]PIR63921.1 MAG: hypothetical protein COU64_01845 [Candidatus Pacebacteria bacterium CG10_big_fil_rev_8_21_14_0_10_40_26]PIZ78420.1 MAG: hypothetical protein COY01_04140 [Candidatus Pacebacteria bacterium CG_4_10_14_0_2_um_filter_40_20]PJA69270.1 MAG: hypothetical protein CO156_00025 [Candidatus Pacebacteria bacterium CG_4_9_14_3_um_filter_40_12]PJC41953.1 MAG: hypothetical protein CO041_01580 [Candidatus Pacebacteria bacterium CG_4_9_